ncbi:DUF1934 domain-containing protein [Robertmurraya beringensis]|uniref:DUF1934 domain-containing protein n=1 Tax=Robertmurraya beringensis TaxID=641660 RepID=A0ABV6KRD3_9BACI
MIKGSVWPLPIQPADQITVKIKVHTMIENGGEKETFELTTFGRYYVKNASGYLQYEESTEEGPMKTTMKLTEDGILLMRSGSVKMRMLLEEKKQHRGSYTTPFGELLMITDTKELQHRWNSENSIGTIEVLYDLLIQGSKAGTYKLQIVFEEEKR